MTEQLQTDVQFEEETSRQLCAILWYGKAEPLCGRDLPTAFQPSTLLLSDTRGAHAAMSSEMHELFMHVSMSLASLSPRGAPALQTVTSISQRACCSTIQSLRCHRHEELAFIVYDNIMVLPEPFTAVAASLGLLSTFFGLLVTSVRTILEIGEDFRNYQLELSLLSNKVDDVLQKVEHIDRTWVAGTSFGEDLYTKILGGEAAAQVAKRAKLVEASSQVVLKVFRKGYDVETWRERVGLLPQNTSGILRPEDSLAWKEWAEQVFRGFAQRVRVEHVLASQAAKRVTFAMLRRADLARKVKSLEEAMQSFESCLQNHFRGLPSIGEKPSEPDREYLKSFIQLAGSHQELTDCLLREYHATLSSSRQCGVYLAEAERRTVYQDLLARAQIRFELCISLPGAPDSSRDGELARIQWPDIDDASKIVYGKFCIDGFWMQHQVINQLL